MPYSHKRFQEVGPCLVEVLGVPSKRDTHATCTPVERGNPQILGPKWGPHPGSSHPLSAAKAAHTGKRSPYSICDAQPVSSTASARSRQGRVAPGPQRRNVKGKPSRVRAGCSPTLNDECTSTPVSCNTSPGHPTGSVPRTRRRDANTCTRSTRQPRAKTGAATRACAVHIA